MTIKCMLCGEELNWITWSHLKSVHNMDTLEYQRMFPNAYMMDEEMRHNISEKNSGSMHTVEAKRLMSEAHMGHAVSEETKRKISEAIQEYWKNPENVQAMSKTMQGNQNGLGGRSRLGYVNTEEAKQLQREASTGLIHSKEAKQAMSRAKLGNQNALGYKHTEETKQAQSETMKELFKDPEYLRRWSEAQHKKPNRPELQLQSILDKHFPGEWKYTGDGTFWLEGKNPDFMNINGKKQVIEIFGVYWHDDDEVETRIAHFKEYGFDCLIFWEFDVWDEEEVVDRVKSFGEEKE